MLAPKAAPQAILHLICNQRTPVFDAEARAAILAQEHCRAAGILKLSRFPQHTVHANSVPRRIASILVGANPAVIAADQGDVLAAALWLREVLCEELDCATGPSGLRSLAEFAAVAEALTARGAILRTGEALRLAKPSKNNSTRSAFTLRLHKDIVV